MFGNINAYKEYENLEKYDTNLARFRYVKFLYYILGERKISNKVE